MTFIVAIAVVAFICVFVFKAKDLLEKAKRIDSEGIETDAVVSRIETDLGDEDVSSSEYTYVRYTDENGIERESVMGIAMDIRFEIGDVIRIRYIPGEYDMVRPVKK